MSQRSSSTRSFFRSLCILCASLCILFRTATADAPTPVRIGVFDFYPLSAVPESSYHESCLFTGLLHYIAQEEGWKIVPVPGSMPQSLQRLKNGEVDLVPAVSYSQEATQQYDFSNETVISTWATIYALSKAEIRSLLDLSEKNVGVVRDDPYNQHLHRTVKRLDMICTIVEFNSAPDVMAAIEAGWIDAGVVDRLYGITNQNKFGVQKMPVIFSPIELRFATAKGKNQTLLDAIDYHVHTQKNKPMSRYHTLLHKTLGNTQQFAISPAVKWILLAATGLVLLLLGMSVLLRRQVKKKTALLSRNNHALEKEVSRRAAVEEQLRKSNNLLEKAFESLRDGLLVIGAPELSIIHCNSAAANMLDYQPDELRTQPLQNIQVTIKSVYEIESTLHHEIGKKGFLSDEFTLIRKDRSSFPAEVVITPVREGDPEPELWVMIIRDITVVKELKKSEMMLRQAQKMEAIGTLAGGIAHDFNNILMPILGYSELLRKILPKIDPKTNEYIDQITNAGFRAKDLVHQILAFSRQGEQKNSPIHIIPIVKEVAKLLRASVPSTINIEVSVETDEDIVAADPSQIHQVIMNLCTNATYAMRGTRGTMSIRLCNHNGPLLGRVAEKNGTQHHNMLRLSVGDTGMGIQPGIVHRIFEPFFTTKGNNEGTGMGLSVVHGIVKSVHGLMSLETEAGKGTTFHVYFPRQADMVESKTTIAKPCHRGNGEKVLLVDDEEMIVDMTSEILTSLNYSVETSTSSEKALRQFSQSPNNYDIVITDHTMPGLTGAELSTKMLDIRPDLPIIICTGFSENLSAQRAKALGIREYLMKPVDPEQMASTVRNVLNSRSAHSRNEVEQISLFSGSNQPI